jgi:hypothetical protein
MASKYLTLRSLAQHFPVPALVALTERDLARLWRNHAEMRHAVERIVTSIRLTSSAFLDEHLDELEGVLYPEWQPGADVALASLLASAGLQVDEALAVRSSGASEDAKDHSYAGLYLSLLDVSGLAALRQAIESVWKSNFGRAVLIERVRLGVLTQVDDMTVIVQRMVSAEWAGVAFSHDPITGEPVCLVEAVPGVGEALVSGERVGVSARIAEALVVPLHSDAALNALLRRVGTLAGDVSTQLGGQPVDVEWAFAGRTLWLLQARRITTIGEPCGGDGTPVFQSVPLYAAADAELDGYRPLPDFAQYFRSKRKPLADFAMRLGLPAATSLLVRANHSGLREESNAASLMAHFQQDELLLDLSAGLRQQSLARLKVVPRLREMLGASVTTFVLRDFVKGQAGLITQFLPAEDEPGEVLCEWSVDGLLAINRGTATTSVLKVDADGHADVPVGDAQLPFFQAHGKLLHAATLQAQNEFGQVQLEWVVEAGRPYLIDYSRLDAVNLPRGGQGAHIISVGYANGQPLLVESSRDLEQLSIAASVSLTDIPKPGALGGLIEGLYERIRDSDAPVIIVSPRPYAALAPLVPFVKGFLFEKASTLCHLAILLREQGVPAIESSALYRDTVSASGRSLTIDASIR